MLRTWWMLAAVTCTSSIAQMRLGSEPVFDPTTWVSRSKEWSVRVEPADRMGSHGARMKCMRGGTEVWAGDRDWALRDVTVTDKGFTCGWSRTEAENHVVVMDPTGRTVLDVASPVAFEGCMSVLGEHALRGIVVLEDAEEIVVRTRIIAEASVDEAWKAYRLSDGQLMAEGEPAKLVSGSDALPYVLGVRGLVGRPLVLVQWNEATRDRTDDGTRFVLFDAGLHPVWSFDLPHDFETHSDADRERVSNRTRAGTILDVLPDGRFDLEIVAEKQRVSFAAEHDPSGIWRVRELGRKPLSEEAPPVAAPAEPAPVAVPVPHLEPLGVIDLLASDQPLPEVRDVADFDFDSSGHVVLSRLSEKCRALDVVCVDAQGRRLAGAHLDALDREQGSWTGQICCPRAGHVIAAWESRTADPRFTLVDLSLADGQHSVLDARIPQRMLGLEPWIDGGFVVLGDNVLTTFGADDHVRWRRTDKDQLCGAEALAIQPGGGMWLLDMGGLQLVSARGTVGAYTKLEGSDQFYFGSLTTDANGAVVIESNDGFLRVDDKGRCSPETNIRGRDGHQSAMHALRGDKSGKLWATDRDSIVRLDEHGVVDLVLGEVHDVDSLREVAAITVGPDDTIHAVASRSGTLAVFDATGKRLRTSHAAPTDFNGNMYGFEMSLSLDDDGSLGVASNDQRGFVVFGADGRRAAREDVRLAFEQYLYFQRGSDLRWLVSPEAIELRHAMNADAKNATVRRIDKSPSGSWLQITGPGAVAADGSLAVVANGSIIAYDAHGDVLAARPAPQGKVRVQRIDWDGRRVAFVADGVVHVIELATGAERVFEALSATVIPTEFWSVHFAAHGREVWLFDGERNIRRYAVP